MFISQPFDACHEVWDGEALENVTNSLFAFGMSKDELLFRHEPVKFYIL